MATPSNALFEADKHASYNILKIEKEQILFFIGNEARRVAEILVIASCSFAFMMGVRKITFLSSVIQSMISGAHWVTVVGVILPHLKVGCCLKTSHLYAVTSTQMTLEHCWPLV